jgi:hypothetical protein
LAAAPALPVPDLARLSLSLAVPSVFAGRLSGLVMFATQPNELLSNRAFTLKMLLLLIAGSNAAWFHGASRWTAGCAWPAHR